MCICSEQLCFYIAQYNNVITKILNFYEIVCFMILQRALYYQLLYAINENNTVHALKLFFISPLSRTCLLVNNKFGQ